MKLYKSLTTVTPFSKFLALILFILLPFGGFYVGTRYQQALDETSMLITQQADMQVQTQPKGVTTITLSDKDKTIKLKVGEVVQLALGGSNTWTVHIDNPAILQRYNLGIAEVSGSQGRYKAVAPGTANITATGTASCPKWQMCPMYAIQFNATVVVSQ